MKTKYQFSSFGADTYDIRFTYRLIYVSILLELTDKEMYHVKVVRFLRIATTYLIYVHMLII